LDIEHWFLNTEHSLLTLEGKTMAGGKQKGV